MNPKDAALWTVLRRIERIIDYHIPNQTYTIQKEKRKLKQEINNLGNVLTKKDT